MTPIPFNSIRPRPKSREKQLLRSGATDPTTLSLQFGHSYRYGDQIDSAAKEAREHRLLYRTKDGWSLDKENAEKDAKKNPIKLGKDGKPSEANHGNVTPSISDGGFTIDYAEQTTVLSLPALRRLRFPTTAGQKGGADTDTIARTYLAALGLLGATLALEAGYDLRSRCLLRATEPIRWHLLGRPGEADIPFDLTRESAITLYGQALAAAEKAGLLIHKDEVVLTPSADLVTLIKKSMELAASAGGTEGQG